MVGLSRKRVFPKTKGDSITGQDRAQKHCDFRFSQIEKNLKSQFCNYYKSCLIRVCPVYKSIKRCIYKIRVKVIYYLAFLSLPAILG